MTAPEKKTRGDLVVIKEFFEMSATVALAETKTLTPNDKRELGEGIRNGSLTY